jgi:hypothetical protein
MSSQALNLTLKIRDVVEALLKAGYELERVSGAKSATAARIANRIDEVVGQLGLGDYLYTRRETERIDISGRKEEVTTIWVVLGGTTEFLLKTGGAPYIAKWQVSDVNPTDISEEEILKTVLAGLERIRNWDGKFTILPTGGIALGDLATSSTLPKSICLTRSIIVGPLEKVSSALGVDVMKFKLAGVSEVVDQLWLECLSEPSGVFIEVTRNKFGTLESVELTISPLVDDAEHIRMEISRYATSLALGSN